MTLRSVLFPRQTQAPVFARPSLTLYFLLAGAFLLTLVPHVTQFPFWLSVTIVAAMVVRSIMEYYHLPLPSTTFCGIVAIILLGTIYWQYNTFAGRQAGTAFTAGLLTVKFYEIRSLRDISLIIFSCFFVVMSALLYSQVLELFIYCLIMMWVLTALLSRVHTGDLPQDSLLRMLHGSGLIFLQAFPLALFLFFFFPRYTGKIGINLDSPSVGLTDTVNPGSIASLAKNDSEAMYVTFTRGIVPSPDAMYWRALVLWDYNNGTWTTGEMAAFDSEPAKPRLRYESIDQEITIWPHNQRWLFALDAPISTANNSAEPFPWARTLHGDVLQIIDRKLEHKSRYTVTSSPTLADEILNDDERKAALRYAPEQINPEVRALADQLHQGIGPGQEDLYVRAVLDYFRRENFVYSLDPGIQGKNWLPVFLFRTKTGFCEHFASAFAILMRLENVPVRLVVGYQGAQYNPYAQHYSILQSNAHAWDEIWIDAKNQPAQGELGHWQREDPTAIFMAEEGSPGAAGTNGAASRNEVAQDKQGIVDAVMPNWLKEGLQDLKLRREQVETDWDNLVFSYDPEAQSRLAQVLGFGQQDRIALIGYCLIAAGICVAVFQKWMLRKTPISPVENLYAEFCRRMARRGIPRSAWEGPLAYTDRVAEAFPEDKLAIRRFGSIVTHARYGATGADPSTPQDLKTLLTLITASQAALSSRERR
jgi:hypothetical protein